MAHGDGRLEWLDPPGDGLDAVYRRIRRRHRRRAAFAGLAAAGLAVGLFAGLRQTALPPESRALLARYEAAEHRPELRVIGGTALELTDAGSTSRVYLVSTTPATVSDGDG